jgi:hypothetical protein
MLQLESYIPQLVIWWNFFVSLPNLAEDIIPLLELFPNLLKNGLNSLGQQTIQFCNLGRNGHINGLVSNFNNQASYNLWIDLL